MRKMRVATRSRSNFGTSDPAPLEVDMPDVAVDEGDQHRRAQEDEESPDVVAAAGVQPIDPGGGVAAEVKGEELEEKPKRHSRATLQETPESEGEEKSRDESRDRRDRVLGINQGQHSLGEKITDPKVARQAQRHWTW